MLIKSLGVGFGMSALRRLVAACFVAVLLSVTAAIAAEQVGEAVVVRTSVTGGGGPIFVKSPIHRDERIRTSNSGLGQFLFRDGTKLAVGWGSSVVIDKFVFDDSNTAKKLTIRATKGTFRWISGGSKSTAYEIITPAGTLGVRGTAFDFFVGANGVTAVVLYSGSARFCGSNGCQTLNRRCDSLIARRGSGVSRPERVRANFLSSLGSARALPFLTGDQTLTRSFSVAGGCMQSASAQPLETETRVEQKTKVTGPAPGVEPPPPPGNPDRPNRSNSADRPTIAKTPDRPKPNDGSGPSEWPSRPEPPEEPSGPAPQMPDWLGNDDEGEECPPDYEYTGKQSESRHASPAGHDR
jgi:hypothetical protein